MNIDYFMKIQNAYGTKNKREKELAKINREMSKHFEDTFDTEDVLVNGLPMQLMIIKDTDASVYKKKIKSRHSDKFNLGDYVKWNNQIWLITLLDVDEKTWNCGYMYLCTIPLRWQNSEGKIIERFAYSEDFTKYSGGTSGNSVITIGDNQYGLTLPIDSETKKLKRDMRFPIDFEDAEKPDIYMLGNRKVNLSNDLYFGRGGTMTITLKYDAYNIDSDKRVIMNDGSQVWICNYVEPTSSTPLPPFNDDSNETTNVLIPKISFTGEQELKVGGNYKSITGYFENSNGETLSDAGQWEIIVIDELLPYVQYTIADNMLKIRVLDNDFTTEGKLRIIFSDKTNYVSTYLDFNITSSI